MRICFLSADRGISLEKHNGAAAHVRSLVRTFVKLGHEVLFVTPSTGGEDLKVPVFRSPTPHVLEALLTDVGANGMRPKGGRPPTLHQDDGATNRERKRMAHALGHIWNNVMVEQSLQTIFSTNRPDLLFEVYSPYGAAAGILAKQMHVRHILNVHAPLAWEGMQYRQQALQEAADALERIAFESAQMIVTNSEELRQQLIVAGVATAKIVAVPNGVDTDMFSPNGKKRPETMEGKIVIGFVGSLKAWHGIDLLVSAFRQLAVDPRLHLLVVGDGPMAKPLKRLSDEFPGRITLSGTVPLESVPSYIGYMDVAVAPYPPMERFYFSPLKVLEYMASGKAVVASNIGQIAEMIRDGQTGLLVSPGDVSAFVSAVSRLTANEQLRRTIGDQAAVEAGRKHTWTQRASEIIQVAEAMELP